MLTQRQACEGEGQAVPAATQVIIIEKKIRTVSSLLNIAIHLEKHDTPNSCMLLFP